MLGGQGLGFRRLVQQRGQWGTQWVRVGHVHVSDDSRRGRARLRVSTALRRDGPRELTNVGQIA